MTRVEPDGFRVVSESLVVLLPALASIGADEIGFIVIRIEADRLIAVGDRLLALFRPDHSPSHVARAGVRMGGDLTGEIVDRVLRGDGVVRLDPTADRIVLHLQPEPGSLDVSDGVNAELGTFLMHKSAVNPE